MTRKPVLVPCRPDPAGLLGPVVEAVRLAGAPVGAELHRPGGPRSAPGHAEALIDVKVELLLRERLLALHPCAWRGEELGPSGPAGEDAWAVDPQDGTRALLAGLRGWAVSVALLRQGEPMLGVVFAPAAPDDGGDLFAWLEGVPATRNGAIHSCLAPGGLGERSAVAMNEVAGNFAAANHAASAPAGVLALSSLACRLALAAAGEADAAISLTQGLHGRPRDGPKPRPIPGGGGRLRPRGPWGGPASPGGHPVPLALEPPQPPGSPPLLDGGRPMPQAWPTALRCA